MTSSNSSQAPSEPQTNHSKSFLSTTQKILVVGGVLTLIGGIVLYRTTQTTRKKERTLVVIKPDAYEKKDQIKERINREGFMIIAERRVNLTPEQVSVFYAEHSQKKFYTNLMQYMSSGPVLVLALEGKDVVRRWRTVMGPTNPIEARQHYPNSIRAVFGGDSIETNAVHGSDSVESAKRELAFFFDIAFDDDM